MYHLGAYFSNALAAAVDTDIPALTDGIIAIQNSHFLPQEPLHMLGAFATSIRLVRAKLNSPKIRQINPIFLRPVNGAFALPQNNYNIQLWDPYDLIVNGQEELQLLATASGAAANAYGLIMIADQKDPIPDGELYTCRFTSTSTATASAWTVLSYTMDTILPAGQYAMVWSELLSTNGIGHRWIFDNQAFRPGHVSFASDNSRHPYEIYQGAFGNMGYFYTYALPRLEVLCDGADNSFEGYFGVVRVGDISSKLLLA